VIIDKDILMVINVLNVVNVFIVNNVNMVILGTIKNIVKTNAPCGCKKNKVVRKLNKIL
jgi:hypothetical protein